MNKSNTYSDSFWYEGNVPDHVLNFHLLCRELHHVHFAFSLQHWPHCCNLNLIIRSLCLLQRILYKPQVCLEMTFVLPRFDKRERERLSVMQTILSLETAGKASRIGVMNNPLEKLYLLELQGLNFSSSPTTLLLASRRKLQMQMTLGQDCWFVYSHLNIVSKAKICRMYYIYGYCKQQCLFFFLSI